MSIALVRIDDRLVHGQVVEGWVPAIGADRIVVVSDEAAGDATQCALMRLALPEDLALDISSVASAPALLDAAARSGDTVLVLTPGPSEVLRLLDVGVGFSSVNVGGLHYAAGHIQLGKAIFLSREDVRAMEAIAARGVRLEGRAVPGDASENIIELLRARD